MLSVFLFGCSSNPELEYPAGRRDFVAAFFQTDDVFDLVLNTYHGYNFIVFPKDGSVWYIEMGNAGIYKKVKIKDGSKNENANRVTSSEILLP